MLAQLFSILNNSYVPWGLSGTILLVAFAFYLRFKSHLNPVSAQIAMAEAALRGYREGKVTFDTLSEAMQRLPHLEDGWHSFKSVLRKQVDELDGRETMYTLQSPVLHLSEARILASAINLRLYQALPNIFVGVGLFFTFIGLVMALYFASEGVASASVADAQKALKNLLSAATFKFLTSLAGLMASIAFSSREKVVLHRIAGQIDNLHLALEATFHTTSLEHLSVERNAALKRQEAVFSDMLNEARQQTAQLKRFETDFAVSIASALDNKLSPRFLHLTETLTKAIENLSERIGAANQDALQKMLEDFQKAMTEGAGDELKRLAGVLEGLAENLQATGKGLGEDLGKAGAGISTGAEVLERVLVNLKADIVDLGDVVKDAVDGGKDATKILADNAVQLAKVHEALGDTLSELNEAGTVIGGVSRDLKGSLDDLKAVHRASAEHMEAMTKAATDTHAALTDAGERISAISGTLENTWQSYRDRFETVDEDLEKTFKALQDGLESYADKIRGFHGEMDGQFGKAVQSLGALIKELSDMVDDLNDPRKK